MSEVVEKVRQLRAEFEEQEQRLSALRTEKVNRLVLLCRRGVVPESEAVALFTSAVDALAGEGERRFLNGVRGYARPRHASDRLPPSAGSSGPPESIFSLLGFRSSSPGVAPDHAPETLAFLFRDKIVETGRAMIAEAVREADQQDRLVPGEDARVDEIRDLEAEIDQVANEQEAVRDELDSLNREQDRASAPDAEVYYRRGSEGGTAA
jgi:hypothetical protein